MIQFLHFQCTASKRWNSLVVSLAPQACTVITGALNWHSCLRRHLRRDGTQDLQDLLQVFFLSWFGMTSKRKASDHLRSLSSPPRKQASKKLRPRINLLVQTMMPATTIPPGRCCVRIFRIKPGKMNSKSDIAKSNQKSRKNSVVLESEFCPILEVDGQPWET